MSRKVSGTKPELRARLRSVCEENNRGWNGRTSAENEQRCYLASGEHRHVYAGEYTKGPRKGMPSVTKIFKTGEVHEATFFEKDILAAKKAAGITMRGTASIMGMHYQESTCTFPRYRSPQMEVESGAWWSLASPGNTTSSIQIPDGCWIQG